MASFNWNVAIINQRIDRTAKMYATIALRSAGFKLARCDMSFTIFGQSSREYFQIGGKV